MARQVSMASKQAARKRIWEEANGDPRKIMELQPIKGRGSVAYNWALVRAKKWAANEIYVSKKNWLAHLI